jgi:hypothetical protein
MNNNTSRLAPNLARAIVVIVFSAFALIAFLRILYQGYGPIQRGACGARRSSWIVSSVNDPTRSRWSDCPPHSPAARKHQRSATRRAFCVGARDVAMAPSSRCPGNILIIKAGGVHSFTCIGDVPLMQLDVHLSPRFIQKMTAWITWISQRPAWAGARP